MQAPDECRHPDRIRDPFDSCQSIDRRSNEGMEDVLAGKKRRIAELKANLESKLSELEEALVE